MGQHLERPRHVGVLGRGGGRQEPDGGDRDGTIVSPAVLADVDPQSGFSQDELFGPAVAVSSADDWAGAIAQANGTPYGLGAGIFTALLTSAPTIPHTAIPQVGIFTHLWVYAGIAGIVMLALALLVRRPRFVPAEVSPQPSETSVQPAVT